MSALRIVLANGSLAAYPQGGGHWTCLLQPLLGLKALGHDVFWLEAMGSKGNPARDQALVAAFFARMAEYGVADRCMLLLQPRGAPLSLETAEAAGKEMAEIREIIRSADLLWNFASTLRQPVLSLFRRRALLDLDPGHWQVSALDWDLGQHDHHAFLTVGSKIQDPDCEVPTLGRAWTAFPPVVYLPLWAAAPDPGPAAPFSSITQWNWGELWLGKRVLSISKRDGYLRYLALPRRTGRRFELGANIHPDDPTPDRPALQEHGWTLVQPHEVADSPASYQRFIAASRAEISCPKPIYRELRTGWLSDRSAGYLASGRPVLAEDTGFTDRFPAGEGLLAFRTEDEAAAGVAAIDGDYRRHSRAARAFAEEHLDSRRSLPAMLAACDG
jgi:hypothetical protein